ncbi:MAG: hypothetical protein NTY45_12040 [Elusimicrobia bacterium]|nr:hypothetical protein [Elusimicrobiota bacterium]
MKNIIGIAGLIAFVSAGSCLAADAAGGSFEARLNVSNIAGVKVAAPAAPSHEHAQPGPGQHQFPPPGPGHHPGGPGNQPWPQPGMYQKCQDARNMELLSRLAGADISDETGNFVSFICSFRAEPVQTVRYPDGKVAFVGPEFADKGSWKYPNGKYAYVGEYYQDRQSWRYPNGNFAFVGPNYQDKGSWRYPGTSFAFVGEAYADKGSWRWPNGKFAYVGEYYQDKQSWRYPGGGFAYVGPAYSDAGSWKYPNGKYALGGANTWYNPDGSMNPYGQQGDGIETLTRMVGAAYNTQFPYYQQLWGAPDSISTMFKLQWIEQTMGTAKTAGANKGLEQAAAGLLEPGLVSIAPGSASVCYSDRASAACGQTELSPLK